MTLPLYRRVLGPAFDLMPAQVRALHDVRQTQTWRGQADVLRGTSLAARLVALVTRLPPTAEGLPLSVTFTPDQQGERWRRCFGSHVFPSHQRCGEGAILERVGPTTITLVPVAGPDGLRLHVAGMTLLGIPMPAWVTPMAATREYEDGGVYRFEVEAMLPFFGRLIRYRGWLEPDESTSKMPID